MKISFDRAKRETTLNDRGRDFLDAGELFDGPNFRLVDDRHDYGEERIVTIGRLHRRIVVVVWTQHIISMRKANDREQARYGKFLD